jgi:hypothetical protein
MSEQTNKFFIDASLNHLIEVRNNSDALLTIHNDGTITAAEHLKPTETAAEVLRIMRETWMADAQSKKIRYQQERIKRLEDIISRASSRFFRDGSNGMVAIGMLNILEEVRLK